MNSQGQTILITGATGTIGQSCARFFSKAQANLILLASNERALEQLHDDLKTYSPSCEISLCTFDLCSATTKEYESLRSTIESQFDKIDRIIHCAGHLKALTPLAQTNLLQWHQTIQLNLNAKFCITQSLLPLLQQSEKAQLVFTLSDLAITNGQAYWGAYQVCESALKTMIEVLHVELTNIQIKGLIFPPTQSRLRKKAYPFESQEHLVKPAQLELCWESLLRSNISGPIEHVKVISEAA